MKYTLITPCDMCPFLIKLKSGFTMKRLLDLASGEFACHKTCTHDEENGEFIETENSVHCAGALIFLERRKSPQQMMRICERLGLYDHRKLDMKAAVR